MDCSCVCYFCHLAKIAIADFVGAEHLVIFNLAMAFERGDAFACFEKQKKSGGGFCMGVGR